MPFWKSIPYIFPSVKTGHRFGEGGFAATEDENMRDTETYNTSPSDCYYTVGTTLDGRSVLKVTSNEGCMLTLTMSDSETKRMIRLLTATLEEKTTEEGSNAQANSVST